MSTLLELLLTPGALIGGLAGVAVALALNWAFDGVRPELGAIIIVLGCAAGLLFEYLFTSPKRE